MSNKVFLSHIGGLRGIAILLVILFHLCPAVFPNCYYGVDIFLVITGYLLFLGAGRNDGTLKGAGVFALKKSQRILPALSVAIFLTVVLGIYFLDKTLLEATGRLGRYALFGMANNHLNKVITDYFDTTAAKNPLLHTWYIGVTLQVYLAFAIGYLVSKRISAKATMRTLVTIGGLSLAWKYRMEIQSVFAAMGLAGEEGLFTAPTHYETLPRLWEVLAGGLILLLPRTDNNLLRGVAVLAGLLCISTAFWLSQAEVLVVLGTMLIIAYAGGSKVEWLLSNKVLLGIGAVSFSLYLIHMPVFAFYKGWIVVPPTTGEYIAMLAITAVLGVLFWYLVEKRHFAWKVWVSMWVVCMLLCVLVKKTNVISDWVAGDNEAMVIKSYPNWQLAENPELMRGYDKSQLLYWGGVFLMTDTHPDRPLPENPLFRMGVADKTPNFVMFGDSHAGAMYAGFNEVCRQHNRAGIYLPCVISPFWNYEVKTDEANYAWSRKKMRALLQWLEAQSELEYVIVVQRWFQRCKQSKFDWDQKRVDTSLEAHTEGLREFLRQLNAIGKKVILLDQIPDFETDPRTYGKWCVRHNRKPEERIAPFLCSVERYHERHGDFLHMLDTVQKEGLCEVLSFDLAIGPDNTFTAYADGCVLYRDDNHPATPGSIYYAGKIAPDFLKLVPPNK